MTKIDLRVPIDRIVRGRPWGARLSDAKAKQASKITALRESLICSGYDTLQKQATVLGLSRSTAWHLLNGDYKGSGLSASTIRRILASPALPAAARTVVQEYVAEKLLGAYGHDQARLRFFRMQLGYPDHPVGACEIQEYP